VELAAFAPPRPDRAFEVGCVDDDTEKAVLADRIVSRAYLERHLMVGTKVDGLDVARWRRSQKWTRCPYLLESRSSGTMPFSNCGGSAHSLETM
jgi:hypothetical protein